MGTVNVGLYMDEYGNTSRRIIPNSSELGDLSAVRLHGNDLKQMYEDWMSVSETVSKLYAIHHPLQGLGLDPVKNVAMAQPGKIFKALDVDHCRDTRADGNNPVGSLSRLIHPHTNVFVGEHPGMVWAPSDDINESAKFDSFRMGTWSGNGLWKAEKIAKEDPLAVALIWRFDVPLPHYVKRQAPNLRIVYVKS